MSQWDIKSFEEKIVELRNLSRTHEDFDVRILALKQLGYALIHHRNPNPDYFQGLSILEEFRGLLGEKSPPEEVLNTLKILNELKILTTLLQETKNKYAQLEKASLEYQEIIKEKNTKIKKLEENMKKLDTLHMQIEKKRKRKNGSPGGR